MREGIWLRLTTSSNSPSNGPFFPLGGTIKNCLPICRCKHASRVHSVSLLHRVRDTGPARRKLFREPLMARVLLPPPFSLTLRDLQLETNSSGFSPLQEATDNPFSPPVLVPLVVTRDRNSPHGIYVDEETNGLSQASRVEFR